MRRGTLEKLLKKGNNFVQVAKAARQAGVSDIGGRSYELLALAMMRDLGRERAVAVASETFARSLDAKVLAALHEAAAVERWPRRTSPPSPLRDLFKTNGEPTRMGAGVLAWARGQEPSRPTAVSSASAQPKLPANMDSILPFMEIEHATAKRILPLLPHAPEYGSTEYVRLVENTIGAIHQIPRLYRKLTGRKIELKQIEAYFGRSSGGVTNLRRRWAAAKQRNHTYGLVFARCSVASSLGYERHGILLLDVLRKHNGLCISNNSMKAVGKVGAAEPGLLYMTFRILDELPELPARELSRADIESIVRKNEHKFSQLANDKQEAANMSHAFSVGLDKANDTSASGALKLAQLPDDDRLVVLEPASAR
jgi:hypothetical protein